MIAWLTWLFDTFFGCSHRRITFPITPARNSRIALDGLRKRATYVVCLDCGKEFDYDWNQMRLGNAVAVPAVVPPLTQRSANS